MCDNDECFIKREFYLLQSKLKVFVVIYTGNLRLETAKQRYCKSPVLHQNEDLLVIGDTQSPEVIRSGEIICCVHQHTVTLNQPKFSSHTQ